MTPARLHAILSAVKTEWRTVGELAPTARASQTHRMREVLCKLRDVGMVKVRHRAPEVRECGTKQGGPRPMEFKVSSQWGGL